MKELTVDLAGFEGPGTYVVIYHLAAAREVRVGRLGCAEFDAGFYGYVGSALGPGGLAARLRHHLAPPVRPHWHVDYLRCVAGPVAVWAGIQPIRREHDWARLLSQGRGAVPVVQGFGTSDCNCPTHLFWWRKKPALAGFRRRVRIHLPGDPVVGSINLGDPGGPPLTDAAACRLP